MINEETVVVDDKLELIDALQQLGVAYHFEEEIKHALDSIFSKLDGICMEMKDNAYAIALVFRLLRGHGFRVSQDIFDQFKDEKGSFKSNLSNRIKSLLNLYEASYLVVDGEDTLIEAQNFTIQHLNNFLSNSSHDSHKLRDYVANALEQPLEWRVERLHTRWFIDAYEKEEKMRPLLLEFAKLDFNVVQNTYKRELKEVSRWWSNLGLWEKLPFSRDRLAENYLWSIGCAFEPKHSTFRLAQTKANCLITAIDDVYDVYGSLDELELFTKAVDSPDVTQEDLNLFQDYPEIVRWSSMLLRLYNDLGTSKPEHQRGDVAKSIHCCMHHEGITEAAACKRIKELIYDCWKKLNGARRVDSAFNKNFTDIAMNVPRTARCFYIHGDGTIWDLTISPPLSPDVLVRLRLTSTRRCETHLVSPSSRSWLSETHLTLPAGNWL
uniref:Uncharacterized protein n=1 Tax=Ananas comosus var. bracteatus TaxID=296719 RepID=A0A6V7NV75_ANACO|nr:unnamed protein product [Ananas comosus var. bracteatus]